MVTDMLMFDEPMVGRSIRSAACRCHGPAPAPGTRVTERRGNFMKVEGVGMGCTLIRRDVVAKMIEKYPDLIDTRLTSPGRRNAPGGGHQSAAPVLGKAGYSRSRAGLGGFLVLHPLARMRRQGLGRRSATG
jgi:hypothetical protein